MNELIIAFYKAYKEWLDSGANYNGIFVHNAGLCTNYKRFVTKPVTNPHWKNEMLAFEEHIGASNNQFPFNESATEYYAECRAYTSYRNPKRIAWVNYQVANNQ